MRRTQNPRHAPRPAPCAHGPPPRREPACSTRRLGDRPPVRRHNPRKSSRVEDKMSAREELGRLEASGLIQIAALQPELEYLFRHALVQEAAYASLLKQDRRALHHAAAEAIFAQHPDRERELASVLALHFEQAGENARAAKYLVMAGGHALARLANREAIGFFTRASGLAGESQGELRLRAAVGRGKASRGCTTGGRQDDE